MANKVLFYQNPVPLEPKRHGGCGLADPLPLAFVRDTRVLPLVRGEVPQALRHWPIVFLHGAKPTIAAVISLTDGHTPFVTPEGGWYDGVFLPGYIRRYPFLLAGVEGKPDEMVLCVDEAADGFGLNRPRPLFDGDKPTELLKQSAAFAKNYRDEGEMTNRMVVELFNAGVLEPKAAEGTLHDGRPFNLEGFHNINIDAYQKIPGDTLARWRDSGILHLIHLHIASQANWQFLRSVG